jgi:hypothetical protein
MMLKTIAQGNHVHPSACLPAEMFLSSSFVLQAYGTPFAAPDLQAAAGDLADADLEFAACIAAPPDLDEQMSMNIGRVLSMLEHNRGGQVQAGQVARGAAQAQQQQAPSGG